MDQHEYVDSLELIEEKKDELDRKLTAYEQKVLRGKIGEVLWISLLTRPDLAFDVNKIASKVPDATVKTLLDMNQIVRKAKSLGPVTDLVVKVYTDASFKNRDNQIRSTEGRVILIENPSTGKSGVLAWKTKKIPRVCRSVKSAETRALDDGLDEAVHIARMLKEVYNGNISLKSPDQVEVVAKIDSKSLWENLHNTRQCEEKMLRSTIAGIKELMQYGIVKSVDWVATDKQLADCLTKKGSASKSNWLLRVAETNLLNYEKH